MITFTDPDREIVPDPTGCEVATLPAAGMGRSHTVTAHHLV